MSPLFMTNIIPQIAGKSNEIRLPMKRTNLSTHRLHTSKWAQYTKIKIRRNPAEILVHLFAGSWNTLQAEIQKTARMVEESGLCEVLRRAA